MPSTERERSRHVVVLLVARIVPIDLAARQELLEMDPVDREASPMVDLLQRQALAYESWAGNHNDTEKQAVSKTQRDFFCASSLIDQREPGREKGRQSSDRARSSDRGSRSAPRGPARGGARAQPAGRELRLRRQHGMVLTYLEVDGEPTLEQAGGDARSIHPPGPSGPGRGSCDLEKISYRMNEIWLVKKLWQERDGEQRSPGSGDAPVPAEPCRARR